ncbi:MAG: tRNA (adenosine(37)-N6)-threonylcarbamoyltransferase complex ATPase subunit type 1 TsaE [Acidobacteria bacterium RIFCSPLOWO2_02_FULL_67_36]|nr:MAG: tRNA (adenosine(37)-N6)-threonylcarbamoyltransferase complex ATPase subunit type 1 TsaE [Acidobacteria bacterium RIFCSPLOWO2_02_FULL_67_36]OFW19624.1 MAG: tRNA (adenosine(37)-N6)-threonylcarbamoyltransferase complex ATPase subunit type 1 TsaE [Acidobacteria bacterium RIFCSPLOWO2_12_FULL_66_21]
MTEEIRTSSEDETAAAGERLAASLNPGDVVLLYGDLGAGKTAFVRGLARGLGAPPEDVSSPTFTIVQEYHGRATLYHVDLYRLEPAEVDDLGLDELVCGDGIVAIEWAERWRGRPDDVIEVALESIDDEQRLIRISDGKA